MSKTLARLLISSLALPLFWLVGCECNAHRATLTMDGEDHARMVARHNELEKRQVVEDIDYFWLQDEPSKLTPYFMPDRE